MTATILLLVLLLVIAVAGAFAFRHRHRRLPRYLTAEDKALVHVQWHQIEQRLRKGGPTNLRQAVTDADRLVDHCLKRLGVPGESMGERLRNSPDRFSDYQGLWSAHKVRNQLVHEMDRELLSFEGKKVIARFRVALQDLGAM